MPSCEMFNISFCMISLLGCSTLYPGKIMIFQEIGFYLLTLSVADTICLGFCFLELTILFQAFYFWKTHFFCSTAHYLIITCLDFQCPLLLIFTQNEEFVFKITSLSKSQA